MNIDKLFDRQQPHSIQAEMCLLGSMLIDTACIGEVLDIVPEATAFYDERHVAIFREIIAEYDRQGKGQIDLVLFCERLKDSEILTLIGGADYLVSLVEGTPSAANAKYYAEVVRAKHRLRGLIAMAGKVLYSAYHPGDDDGASQAIIEQAESELFAITHEWQTSDIEPMAVLLKREMDRLDNAAGQPVGFRTHFLDLDAKTAGLQPEELTIIAARPSMGKTAIALNIVEQIALGGPPSSKRGDPVRVGLFSMEMSRAAIVRRLLSARSGVHGDVFQCGNIGRAAYERVYEANAELSRAPIMIDDTPAMNIAAIRAKARRMVRQHGVKVIVIDYLQLLTAGGRQESRQVEVSAISRGLKAMARELKVPVVCLSQLNRANEQRAGFRPRMSDIRESGSVEQDADVVMLLHREEYYHIQDPGWAQANPDRVGVAELIIAKQRNGPTGVVHLTWASGATRFKDFDPGRPVPEYVHPGND